MSLITSLLQFFSKPASKQQLGVSIGPSSSTFCYLNENNIAIYQESAFDLAISKHSENNESTLYVIDSLKELLTKHQVSGNCHVILSPSYYKIVQVDKPSVPLAEMAGALKWQVNDLVTIEVDDMIVDYFDAYTLAGTKPKVNVVCASKKFLTVMLGSIHQGDTKISTISTEEFAFLSLVPKQDDSVLLVCQQPNAEVVLLIVKNGQLYFYRRLRGFAQLSQQSQQELAMGTTDNLSIEIQRITDYFERQLKQSPIKLIQVIVPSDNEQYLVDQLAQNTDISVQLLALPEQYRGQRKYAVAIGASLFNTLEQAHDS